MENAMIVDSFEKGNEMTIEAGIERRIRRALDDMKLTGYRLNCNHAANSATLEFVDRWKAIATLGQMANALERCRDSNGAISLIDALNEVGAFDPLVTI
jgi:hypothetical protein